MRLRINVIRNGLPDTPVVWAVDTSSRPTIYQLLEQVNEIIPIESDGEWGLEDYVVELKNHDGIDYECLHFQPLTSILKGDDEIVIRCLLSNEIKKRKVSGRTQITPDGRRLFDGVPWGRQRSQIITQRPAIKILPRKPKRLTYTDIDDNQCSEDDDDGSRESLNYNEKPSLGNNSNQQLCLYGSENDDDSENDQDFSPEITDEESTDLESSENDDEKLNHNQSIDENQISEPVKYKSNIEVIGTQTREIQPQLCEHADPKRSSSISALHTAFPTSSSEVCKHVLDGTDGDIGEAWEALFLKFPARISRSATIRLNLETDYPVPSPQSLSVPPKGYDSKANNLDKNFGSQSLDSPIDRNKRYRLPSGSMITKKALSQIARANSSDASLDSNQDLGKKSIRIPTKLSNKSRDSSPKLNQGPKISKAKESIRENSEQSNYLSSSFGVESQKIEIKKNFVTLSDDNSSNDSSSDSEAPEQSSSKLKTVMKLSAKLASPKRPIVQILVPPGKGKKSTQRRNKRRRLSNARNRYEKKGILPAGNPIDVIEILAEKQATSPEAPTEEICEDQNSISPESNSKTKSIEDIEFQLRRKQLLASLATGGVEVSTNSTVHEPPSTSITITNSINSDHRSQSNDSSLSFTKTNASENSVSRASTAPDTSHLGTSSLCQEHHTISDESGKNNKTTPRQLKLDMAAGKRMLLSAMGLKPQKLTQNQNFVGDFQANRNSQNLDECIEYEGENARLEVDHGVWREKIIYRAVECVQEGIELSEPPFPFSQRWDPQQQGCKRKRNKYYQSKVSDENNRAPKKQKQRENTLTCIEDQSMENTDKLNDKRHVSKESDPNHMIELSVLLSPKINDDVLKKNINGNNDLVLLPENLSSLEDLKEGKARVGMVIAFKQLEVSAANRWQPQVSSYKTAIISSMESKQIQIFLARRDIPVSEKKYDEEGNRIYVGFDEIDDEEEEDDDGARSLSFNELIEPKILQQ